MRKRVLQQAGNKVCKKLAIACAGLGLVLRVDWALYLGRGAIGRVNEVEKLHEQHRLRLEACFVVAVRYDIKHILQDGDEEPLEEGVACLHVGLIGNVVDKLQAHSKACRLNVPVVVLECP